MEFRPSLPCSSCFLASLVRLPRLPRTLQKTVLQTKKDEERRERSLCSLRMSHPVSLSSSHLLKMQEQLS